MDVSGFAALAAVDTDTAGSPGRGVVGGLGTLAQRSDLRRRKSGADRHGCHYHQ
ncbi:hypothetical protein [Mycolicibacter heraklionensis]|uniref:hypothetical protein n=1 Tax=Mycolicibacter heraklionensis TaxID=512402 RepID=UPI0013F4F805|nr:hypothetical protein [Mycolicibacter heraklionensis]